MIIVLGIQSTINPSTTSFCAHSKPNLKVPTGKAFLGLQTLNSESSYKHRQSKNTVLGNILVAIMIVPTSALDPA